MKAIGFFICMAMMMAWAGHNTNHLEIDCVKSKCTSEFKKSLILAKTGDLNAQNDVGERLHFGKGVVKDYKMAKEWYLLASNQGHPVAPNHIGRIYLNGEGVHKNSLEACAWYKLSSERGDEWGKVNYHKCRNRLPK